MPGAFPMNLPATNPLVLVTGGTSGIGAGVCRALAAAGHRVIAGTNSAAEIESFQPIPNVTAVHLDVTDQASVDAVLNAIDGELHGLVNCAGIIQRAGAEFEIDGFRRTLEVNLVGTMRMCVSAKPRFARTGAAIVNTASMLSFFGSPLVPGYSASKGGVMQLTRSLAAAWAQENIRVNAVAPGWIATPLTQPLQDNEQQAMPIMRRTPLRRWGLPEEIGSVVRFLLSDEARFMTGAIVPVDGGYSAV